MTCERFLFWHWLRGLAGALAFIGAIHWRDEGWPGLILLPLALVLWRGCPACWLSVFFVRNDRTL